MRPLFRRASPRLRSAAAVLLATSLAAASTIAVAAAPAAAARTPVAHPAAATLRLGSHGAAVRSLQIRLAQLTYLPRASADGVFGMRTWHAVVAFQGWHGLSRDGIVGPHTRAALDRAHPPKPWSTATGFEVHIAQQVLLLVAGKHVHRAIHVSTGSGGLTPVGHFAVFRRETMSWSVRFRVWMPLAQYFHGGYALHEFASVPAYAASHGCVRIPAGESKVAWQFGRLGMRVWTRG